MLRCDITVVMMRNGIFCIDGLRTAELGWIGPRIFKCRWVGFGWVEGMIGWVRLDYENWTHGHVWLKGLSRPVSETVDFVAGAIVARNGNKIASCGNRCGQPLYRLCPRTSAWTGLYMTSLLLR